MKNEITNLCEKYNQSFRWVYRFVTREKMKELAKELRETYLKYGGVAPKKEEELIKQMENYYMSRYLDIKETKQEYEWFLEIFKCSHSHEQILGPRDSIITIYLLCDEVDDKEEKLINLALQHEIEEVDLRVDKVLEYFGFKHSPEGLFFDKERFFDPIEVLDSIEPIRDDKELQKQLNLTTSEALEIYKTIYRCCF